MNQCATYEDAFAQLGKGETLHGFGHASILRGEHEVIYKCIAAYNMDSGPGYTYVQSFNFTTNL
jgi:hypothetical protein